MMYFFVNLHWAAMSMVGWSPVRRWNRTPGGIKLCK